MRVPPYPLKGDNWEGSSNDCHKGSAFEYRIGFGGGWGILVMGRTHIGEILAWSYRSRRHRPGRWVFPLGRITRPLHSTPRWRLCYMLNASRAARVSSIGWNKG